MAHSEEHETAAQRCQGSSLGHSLFLGQNLRTCVSWERIGNIKPVIINNA